MDSEVRNDRDPAFLRVTTPSRVWLPTNQRPQPLSRAEEQLEWIVIMKLGTLVGVHGDRAVAVAWVARIRWSGTPVVPVG